MAKNRPASGQVRIISGQWRSRRLPIHDLEGLRPTTDRVRETLFNWLAGDLAGARVLDCFGGSGALFFESLSRYASYGKVFELQANAAEQLNKNLQTLKCDPTTADVVKGDTLKLLAIAPTEGFDIVYIDPPFRKELAEKSIQLIDENNWLKENAQIYVETESEQAQLQVPANWVQLKEKKAGQVLYRLYQYQP
ncbi:16S rRNA (guanine(966)-N(2))-methyltransferase RsmD [Shewanella eurypsychrophilus]|uniref:Ribosomal RNA small subunit methyltransferase D n=1 Tax=Shewanella eurypsychrophilus TaxID=2593656 RepID=A0ABX6V301_9GAMM|nr:MULTISPECIES: 16S rRNA (guanine(966)-N(2))-methyltransferase RsmD [Shewanella]QFU20628.1 16S rRNA (guanine(966)-N(2))-methyltransferase RsmD [Shewanella sp. YLB-09]QFU20909.1 16S rRNA (guanine(966)-N(2))-methyltransferase RsmD [Shewanella sp. YLB-09]QPG56196.1 16S rRNA (guanine(966)-N(2))-methyltransferase RsmD [Shewanella eurypsychrophilus]